MNSLRRCFSSTNRFADAAVKSVINYTPSEPILVNTTSPDTTFESYQCKYTSSSQFIKQNYHNWTPNSSKRSTLPKLATDIRGLDSFISRQIRSKDYRAMPKLIFNKFFLLKFFPKQHHLSLFRKSNIAYSFTNKSGFRLNDKKLDAALTSYKGAYRKDPWLQKRMFPLETSFGRTRYRRLIKKMLFESLHKLVPSAHQIDLVEGIFQFQFTLVPESEEDILVARNAIERAIRTILTSKSYRDSLLKETKQANKKIKLNSLLQGVQYHNSIGEVLKLNYAPKFPFIGDRKTLL